jgi:outer membrane protein TolC
MLRAILCVYFLCFNGLIASAQGIDEILQQIARNNPQLHAQDKARNAEKIELKTRNNLDRTAVSYSPFFANGVQGIASSELVVSQDFDFPTLYAGRNKMIKKQSEVLDTRFESLRRDVLHDARLLCIQLVHQQKLANVLKRQHDCMARLTSHCETNLQQGNATVMDLNKTRLEAMKLTTAMEECNAQISEIKTTLTALNGNKELALDGIAYPTIDALPDDATLLAQYMANDLELKSAQLQNETINREISLTRQENLPSLSVGYRRNTALEERSHGFLVGAAVPLFSNRNRTRAAKARLESAEAETEHQRIHTESQIRSLISQMHATRNALQAYDAALMQTSMDTFVKACQEGEISVIDCCREQADILEKMQEMLELEQQYHLIVASIMKNN